MEKQRKQTTSARKRSSNACIRCRQQKIGCTGTFPCQPCTRKRLPCTFDESAQKVLVTKGYLQELQSKAEQGRPDLSASQALPVSSVGLVETEKTGLQEGVSTWLGTVEETVEPPGLAVSDDADEGRRRGSSAMGANLTNPLAHETGNYMTDNRGDFVHLGKSSNWSFGLRVLRMSCEKLGIEVPTEGLHFEGMVYDLDWQILQQSTESPTHLLPSADYAVYLINAVKFHCGQMFHLFDDADFMQHFATFHAENSNVDRVPRLWYIHYLLIIAFGKAFVARTVQGGRPPGADLFLQAMRHLPEITFFATDPLECVEILICSALYLQCLDFRSVAYNLIGQAVRKGLERGMHTPMSSRHLSDATIQRCRKIWWTAYVLDRQMSSLMGLPTSVRDEDISAPLPVFTDSPQKTITLDLHVKLSRVIADILNTIYSTEGRLAKRFLASTKQALKSIAAVTDLLKAHMGLPSSHLTAGMSRSVAHLHLLHHQCIVLTTRPLAYNYLERRLRSPGRSPTYHVPTGSVRALLATCIDSAQQMLYILSALQNQGLLESFLPFDLESVFISTMILTMCTAIDASLLEGHASWSEVAYSILDEMISCGNTIALLRKKELQKLASILSTLPPPGTPSQLQPYSNPWAHGGPLTSSNREAMAGGVDSMLDTSQWQDELSAAQLMLIADSLDLDGLDWMTTSLEDSSARSQII